MNLRNFLFRIPINKASRRNGRVVSWSYRQISTTRCVTPVFYAADTSVKNSITPMAHSLFYRFIHAGQETVSSGGKGIVSVSGDSEDDDNAVMNEFLSRFVWIMRGKLTEVYTDADKNAIDAMLRIIVGKVVEMNMQGCLDQSSVSHEFSEDLWNTVWEVSNVVLEDMKKAMKKEKMKSFLHSEEVKEMARFAGEIGIRGDLLRELRFKWAREKFEDSEFYELMERMRQEGKEPEVETEILEASESGMEGVNVDDDDDKEVSLPKRSGKIKYNIYGLDLSKPKWSEVAEQIHERGESIWPKEPKPISGKCKIVTENILSLQGDDDPAPLISEWKELQQPTRVDWIGLLERLKEKNDQLYLKVAELLLDEESFETDVRDYSQLVAANAKLNQFDAAERIINKMHEKGIVPDILTKTTMVHMYSKSGNLALAKQTFESLRSQGFQPDRNVYNSIIMAYVNAGDHKSAESELRILESNHSKSSEDIYLAVLQAYAQQGDPAGAERIVNRMSFAGYQPSRESLTFLVEAYSRKGHPDDARKHFDDIIKMGYKPDDKCIARMIQAYAQKNYLDQGLSLLLQLEKDGIEHGPATYSVLIDWLGKLQLIDDVEGLMKKFNEKGISPSLDVHISLCDMYSRVGQEKKALQALGVIEANKEKLSSNEFEKVIRSLGAGKFWKDAERVRDLMIDRGFTPSVDLNMSLQASRMFDSNNKKPSRKLF